MSLDVCLIDADGKEVYSANITHNLGKMASAAGIYKCLWRPDEHGIEKASQIIEPLEAGLGKLATNKAQFEEFNPPNGWGSWAGFVPWCANYLQACRDNPEALVNVSR
jgi:hypothetical protein